MSKRLTWILAFLGVTLAAVGMEVAAAIVDSRDTPTWTDLMVEHLNWEVFALAWGAFFIWTGVHFGVRFIRKHKARKEN